jgi:protein SCO1/2
MNSESRFLRWGIWGLLLAGAFGIGSLFLAELVRTKSPPLPVLGDVADFHLTNELGQSVSLANLKGSIWVADIIFTRCPGPCLQMSRKMKTLEAALPSEWAIKLVSLTADPEFDTPGILKAYATRLGSNLQQWQFLTGPKKDVYAFATKGLKLAVQENTEHVPEENQFIHSTRFVLIDRQGRLRSVAFDGTEPSTVPELVRAIGQLVKEG